MKKWSMIALAALCLALPARGGAQELPQLFEAVGEGLLEGLEEGAQMAAASLGEELTLELLPSKARIERGETVTLAIAAGNPRAVQTPVRFELRLPQQLASDEALVFEAVLPPAQINEETGVLEPSRTVIERRIAIASGEESGAAQMECEMSMGTRFYRAAAQIAVCLPDISVSAQALGTDEGRLQPGDSFTYRVEIANAGMAAKQMEIEMILPHGMELCGALPEGLAAGGQRIAGRVTAKAAETEPSVTALDVPVRVSETALDGDADAQAVLGGVLRADGAHIAMPRVQVVAPRVSARLIPAQQSLALGETMEMEILVVNAGLAAADVELTCLLPEALELAAPQERARRATQGEAERDADEADEEDDNQDDEEDAPVAVQLPGGGDGAAGAAISVDADAAAEPVIAVRQAGDGTIVYALHMDAAQETEEGVSAAAASIPLRVRAKAGQEEEAGEQLVGASLMCSTAGEPGRMSEAAVIRLYSRGFLGLRGEEWNALFWAALLMAATIVCLYAATRPEKKEDYVFD